MANNNYTFFEEGKIEPKNLFNNEVKGFPEDGTPGLKKTEMKILYPGATFGIGIPVAKTNTDDYDMGINLDYVSGAPVYPSTSIKGLLRFAFSSKDFIKDIFSKYDLNNNEIVELEEKIFESNNVIFFNAVFNKGKNDIRELKDITDYVTPHDGEKFYKNPNVNKFIVVPAGTKVTFRYIIKDIKLKDKTNNEGNEKVITADDISEAFNKIIMFIGFGAKTNQGYGRIEYCDN